MTRSQYFLLVMSGMLVTLVAAANVTAGRPDEDFYRGYFLQQQGDFEGALDAYKAVLTGGANQDIQRRVLVQLDAMSAIVAAKDMARLLPCDTVAYVELAQPANQIERLAALLGLVGRQHQGERVILPVDEGLAIPSDFQISPALMNELKKITGVAVAVTGFEEKEPEVVVLVHAGNSDLIQGLIETGLQVVPQQESKPGCTMFCIDDEFWIAKCGPLLVGSIDRDNIADVLQRLEDGGESLADDENFRQRFQDRENALVFAYLNGPQLARQIGPLLGDDAAIARIIFGLDHLQHVTGTIGITAAGAAAKVTCAYEPGHQSLAYGVLRTVPLKQETLQRIPAGSAVVAALGVNPQLTALAGMSELDLLSGLDLGRELFANVKDISLFVLPSVSPSAHEVPDFGLVVSAHDAGKSEKLWNHWLSLPGMLQAEQGIEVEPQMIRGLSARRYRFPDDDVPELIVVRLGDDSIVLGTQAAVERAAATATGDHDSLTADEALVTTLAQRTSDTSKAVFAHLGRLFSLVALLDGGADKDVQQLSRILHSMRVTLMSDESPSQVTVRLEATGFPLFAEIIKSLAHPQQDEPAVAEY